ncbi:hypothetical protein BO78DRAFT_406937 [Aspergillus sclerotiicarbonarius CBS 121057]|uniref:Uncharacterized protein n=1 Tax=Aspergillus sclerotiicarbonarius (strain CBS 121057 / IBT 28362) TaxID=1448318 RepID=A0A319EH38_ASPSB|nr:hypothetical protein BO78DRAFT_406937 [Aspergillus sclerotiicarbonarius CBS 121057]
MSSPSDLPDLPEAPSAIDLYASGGKGSLRYVFLHGNHAPTNHPEADIEGKVILFNRQGEIVFEENPGRPSAQYHFVHGSCVTVDDQPCPYLPARMFVETLLRNVSIPALVVVEVPKDEANLSPESDDFLYMSLLALGRSDLDPIPMADRTYLEQMSQGFVPPFVMAMARKSDSFLPGDARNLSHEIADSIMTTAAEQSGLPAFLDLYEKRYVHQAHLSPGDILESCLLHILKMPFELNSSIRYRLVSC